MIRNLMGTKKKTRAPKQHAQKKKTPASRQRANKKKTPAPRRGAPRPRARSAPLPDTRLPRVIVDASLAPWAASPQQIRILSDIGLTSLMRRLLLAQAYRCGMDVTKVFVNSEEKATDEGCDGWTPAPPTPDPWLGTVDTCWQFKAGTAGQAAKLVEEVRKKIPSETLRAGGRFAVVTSKAGAGKTDHSDRLDALRRAAKKARLQTGTLEVFIGDTLATWANEHPAIAAVIRGLPDGWWTLERWTKDSLHKEPWHGTGTTDASIAMLRKSLDISAAKPTHVHVYGPPGVGKTRFVLEACREAAWSSSVIYIPQAADVRVSALLDSVADTPPAQLVLVVDEVQPSQVAGFNGSIRSTDGRVRLITIGHDGSPDSTNIDEVKVDEIDPATMAKIVRGWHKTLLAEQVDYVVDFASGFVKAARLAAMAVALNPTISIPELMARSDIRQLMDALLGKAERRRALHVLAMLTSVGWTGKRAAEGQAIADHLGLKWDEVQAEVEAFHARHGIAPRGGDLRYISPKPLGVYLALEALVASPDKMRTLPAVLPNDAARSAFYDRLRAVVESPAARPFVEEELARFTSWTDFIDGVAVERWSALAGADPVFAASSARRALETATHDQRLRIANAARRDMVRTLIQLAWQRDAFTDAALALAELAEAENETWSNNATGEFISRYQLYLGGTSSPYIERLQVIDELLTRGPSYQRLAIAALARIGNTGHAVRWHGPPSAGKPAPPEWIASDVDERIQCAHEALTRLATATARAPEELSDALVKAVSKVSMLLREATVREPVAQFIRAVAKRFPENREEIRLEVHRIVIGEKKHWKEVSSEDLAWLERLHGELEDTSPRGKLRQALARYGWDREEADEQKRNFDAIATGLLADGAFFASEWPWLTSGESVAVWELGEALARVDSRGVLLEHMLSFSGRGADLRIVAGYMRERAKRETSDWIDNQIDEFERTRPNDTLLIFELTWRCASTTRGAERLNRLARSDRLEAGLVSNLVFGGWSLGPSIESLADFLRTIAAKPEFAAGALVVLEQRLSKKEPGDLAALDSIAVTLVAKPELLLAESMTEYTWAQVARKVLPGRVREVVRTIFTCQADRGDHHWSLEHSDASGVLFECVAADPLATWLELKPYLESPEALLFAIGFPAGIVSQLPRADLLAWIEEAPEERASMLAKMIEKEFSDGSLGAELLHRYHRQRSVGGAFFAAYVSGSWTGSPSKHWERLAAQLDQTAKSSKLSGVRTWASRAAGTLRRMAKDDRKREEEERLRYG